MSTYNEVIVRPTEISFSSAPHSLRPVEVLILNRSRKQLRFKILCTARDTYALSKCKGTLLPEGFIKINIELMLSSPEKNRRDFFKIQFFDCLDDSLQGERFVSSVVLSDPTASSYRSLDSDSCNSWPNRSIENLSVASNSTRTLSLVRTSEARSASANQPVIKEDVKASPTSLTYRGTQRPVKSVLKAHAGMTRAVQQKPSSSPWYIETLTYGIQRLFCFLAFSLCFIGICLPLLMDDATSWTHLIPTFTPQPASSTNPPSDGSCKLNADDKPGYGQLSSSCSSSSEPYQSDRRSRNLDEFAHHSQLAISSLKTALLNIYSALIALSPLTLIANLSWFCLGLLVMYTWRFG